MKYILPPIQAIIILLLNLIAPLLVLFILPFIKWDKIPSIGHQRTNPPTPTIMGDLPKWLSWFSTPDQRLPCDTGIIECKNMLDKYGKYYTSWVWIGLRNSLMGLSVWLGKPTSGYIPEDVEGYWEKGDVWIYRKTLGKIRFYTGYTAYAMLDGSFRAAPIFTFKK